MQKHLIILTAATMAMAASCSDNNSVKLPKELEQVRDYVPRNAVMAHRGSTYWAPEETESAWRWAREMGADYLESDLQCTKDGVILANHDDNLTRTTNIRQFFGEGVPECRLGFYRTLGLSLEQARDQLRRDTETFIPYCASSYYYAELLMLDSGSWFCEARPGQARKGFAATIQGSLTPNGIAYSNGQYVSALQDQIAYAEGKRLRRNAEGRRILPYRLREGVAGSDITKILKEGKYLEIIDYDFSQAYEADPQDSGHRPGIYLEFKEPQINPDDMERRVYDILDAHGWNIITSPVHEDVPFYKDGLVNVGRTRGKVILQTFSTESLKRSYELFKGRIPMCFLIWDPCPEEIPGGSFDTEEGYVAMLRWAISYGAHIIGPSISGAPNDYTELNYDWQAALARKAGMLVHPYSFDSVEQMTEQSGRSDGFFTNRTDLTIKYLIDNKMFPHDGTVPAPATVPDPEATLARLGY